MRPGQIIAAAIGTGVIYLLWRRWPRFSPHHKVLVTALVVLLGVYAADLMPAMPDPEKAIESAAQALGSWTYLLVGALAFLETGAFIGLIAPGESAVIVGGVIAGQGEIDLGVLIGLVWLAAFLGDSASFAIGAKLGRGFLVKHGRKLQITEERLESVELYLKKNGGRTIVIGRFIGLVRAIAPFIAGATKMPYRRFAPYDIIGSGLWATTFCVLGYLFWQSLGTVLDYAKRGSLVFGSTVGVIVAIVYLVKRFRQEEERAKLTVWLDEQESHPFKRPVVKSIRLAWAKVLTPLAKVIWPRIHFALNRFTPGSLGIEFTTSVAVAAVGSYGFVFYTRAAENLGAHTTVARANDEAFRLADLVRTEWINEVASSVTWLGALPVVAAVTLLAVIWCLWRRRIAETLVLGLGLATTALLAGEIKDATAVERPTSSFIDTAGYAFPSGHAAYAVMYIAIAIAVLRIGGLASRVAITTVAVALAVAVAASRVYLRAHYLSDVIGGIALAATVLGLFACGALVITHLRDRRRTASPGIGKD